MTKKSTHIGTIKGNDARTPRDYKRTVLLRETKKFWIDRVGRKFRRTDGSGMGTWPMYDLDLDSIKEIDPKSLIND